MYLCGKCGIFALLEWSPSFADPDSYYHAKVALLMAEQRGPIMAFLAPTDVAGGHIY